MAWLYNETENVLDEFERAKKSLAAARLILSGSLFEDAVFAKLLCSDARSEGGSSGSGLNLTLPTCLFLHR
jgi:hypothetical protein